MGKSIMHDYSIWAYQRWEQCCEEREAFGEECLSLDEYLYKYKEYLHIEYIKDKDTERANI